LEPHVEQVIEKVRKPEAVAADAAYKTPAIISYLHQEVKPIYAKRKETIERVFADAKEKHGMRWTTLWGLKKLSMQAMLTFAAINIKKMATWTWQGPKMA
jgi:hypothetical protein